MRHLCLLGSFAVLLGVADTASAQPQNTKDLDMEAQKQRGLAGNATTASVNASIAAAENEGSLAWQMLLFALAEVGAVCPEFQDPLVDLELDIIEADLRDAASDLAVTKLFLPDVDANMQAGETAYQNAQHLLTTPNAPNTQIQNVAWGPIDQQLQMAINKFKPVADAQEDIMEASMAIADAQRRLADVIMYAIAMQDMCEWLNQGPGGPGGGGGGPGGPGGGGDQGGCGCGCGSSGYGDGYDGGYGG